MLALSNPLLISALSSTVSLERPHHRVSRGLGCPSEVKHSQAPSVRAPLASRRGQGSTQGDSELSLLLTLEAAARKLMWPAGHRFALVFYFASVWRACLGCNGQSYRELISKPVLLRIIYCGLATPLRQEFVSIPSIRIVLFLNNA